MERQSNRHRSHLLPEVLTACRYVQYLFAFNFNTSFDRMQRKSSRDGSFFVFPLPIGIVQVIFFCLLMLLLQHPDGLFQLALGSAALAGKGADRFGQAAAEQGVHPLAHGRNAIGPAGDRGQIGVLAPRLAALDQPFSSRRYKKLSTVAGAQPVAVRRFSLMSRRVAGGGSPRVPAAPAPRRQRVVSVCLKVRTPVSPPIFAFTFVLFQHDYTMPGTNRQAVKVRSHAVKPAYFYICLKKCSLFKDICVCFVRSRQAEQSHLCAKMLLFLHPGTGILRTNQAHTCRR